MSEELKKEIEQFNAAAAAREFAPVISRKSGFIEIRGKHLVDFTNWDLFGLNDTPALKRAAQHEIERVGLGATSSRAVSGTRQSHITCEARIAGFLGTESALLFSSKNQAILSLITALTTERDAVYSDELAQSPVADACYLSGSQTTFFKSSNPESLETELKKAKNIRKLVFVESVQAVTGARMPLEELQRVCDRHSAYLCVDESFSIGCIGNRGAGAADLWPLKVTPLVQFADASMSLASYGAFLAGPKYLTRYISTRSRTFSVEPAIPPSLAASIESAIESLELKVLERHKISALADKLRLGFDSIGFDSFPASESPIVSLAFDTFAGARDFEDALIAKGFLAESFPCPTFLENRAVVRFLLQASHTDEQIQDLLGAASEIWQGLKRH